MQRRIEVHRAAGRVSTAWANGGGITREVAALRGPESIEWRISIADVAATGPFSLFPDVDRTIVLISDGELALRFADGLVPLRRWEPFSFPGDVEVHGELGAHPTSDLNVMTARARWASVVSVVESPLQLPAADDVVVLVLEGDAVVTADALSATLGPLDALQGAAGMWLLPGESSRVAVVELHRL